MHACPRARAALRARTTVQQRERHGERGRADVGGCPVRLREVEEVEIKKEKLKTARVHIRTRPGIDLELTSGLAPQATS